jgi:UDP-glucose 4-epimerase
MKKCLVTGGLGFIGSNLVHELQTSGPWNITVVDNLQSARKDWQEFVEARPEIEWLSTCLTNPDLLERLRSGEFDVVFHLAANPRVPFSVSEPAASADANVMNSIRLLEACIKDGEPTVRRFVFSSSSAVYGESEVLPTVEGAPKLCQSPYAWHKSCIEDYLQTLHRLWGLNSVSLRYFNVYGEGQWGGDAYATAISSWCCALKEGRPLRKDGTGEQSRDLCYVGDVARANIAAAVSGVEGSRVYNVATGESASNNRVLELMSGYFGGSLSIIQAPFRQGDVMHTLADIDLIRKDE